jgi:hypothetical protein
MVGSWPFSCWATGWCFQSSLAHNDGSMFHNQWWFCLKRCYVNYHNGPNGVGRRPSTLVHATLWAVLGPILHRLYETEVYCGWFRRQNHHLFADNSSLVAVDGSPVPSSRVTLVQPFLNFSIHSKSGSLNVALLWCKQKAEQPRSMARQ